MDAVKANVSNLNASIANIDSALINKANVGDLTATNATVANLNSDLANVKTLINGNLTSANIQSLVLTSSKVTVDNGFIKNAMIESLDATKINTGSLNTSKISVTSSDGSLLIAGATQQFKDKNGKVRIQMGQDAQGNFNFILVAGDGTTTLIDGTGVKANAIADKLIKANMVADSAIGEQQINYSSFVTGFNKATNTSYINASKVAINLTGQTLDVAFNNINTKVDGVKTTTDTNTTSISAIQGQISTLISNTTITTNGTTTQLKDAYNSTVNTINSMQTTIGQHTSEIDSNTKNITSVTSKEAALEVTVNNISASLSSTQSTVSNQATQITTANNNITTLNTNVSNVTSRVSSLEITATGLTTRVGNTETAISNLSIGGRNLLRNFNSGLWTISSLATVNSNSKITLISSTNYGGDTLGITMSISPSTLYTFRCVANGWMSLREIDANGNQLTRTDSLGTSGLFNTGYIFKTTSTTAKLAIWYGSNSLGSGTYTFEKLKLEKGNQATDWTPAPEDIDSSIQSVKDYATQTINSNVSTINQTTDSIKASVQSLQSSVSSINTTLGNKADSSTVTSVTNRVSTLETSVTGINASITTLNSNVSSVTTTANAAKSAIDNLSIGGRNLITNTMPTSTSTWNNGYASTATANIINENTALSGKAAQVTINAITNSAGGFYKTAPALTSGKIYTWSVYLKASRNLTLTTVGHEQAGRIACNITTSWQKFSYTFTTDSNTYHQFVFYNGFQAGDILYVHSLKLEEGNRATTWTPAPEDVDTQITTINSSVSSLQSSVSVLQNQIALKVEQSNIDSAVTTINGKIDSTNATISSMQSSINLQLNSITSKVNQTVSTKNLLKNSSFDEDVILTYTSGTFTNYRTVTFQNASSWLGFAGTKISDNVLFIEVGSAGDWYAETKNLDVKLTASKTYTLSYYHVERGSWTSGSSYIYFYDSNGVVDSTKSLNVSCSGTPSQWDWARYSVTFTVPSGMVGGYLRFGFHSTGYAWSLIDNVQVEEGSGATDYVLGLNSSIGTTITQSPLEVMTAFNNISSYFKVNKDGATFGDTSTGDYTVLGANGLQHHVGSSNYNYKYITYTGQVSVDVPAGTSGKELTVSYPSDLVTMLNGTVPKGIVSVAFQLFENSGLLHSVGAQITNITSTSVTIKTLNYNGGGVIVSYILIA
ncbi:beta strand repeat-containing protein [Clostridium beijerinckii]|uniref:beta strand repeat-containing protein n=1 Tax=Clostridium beijerinckii TaxID=1520 RepID=UPI00156DF47D|nr:hypothetical protein [Clostridium beijerinckii]NRX89630.1 putative nucleic acid-binding Zn-ribbon protein [Clostridium beijerinckii]